MKKILYLLLILTVSAGLTSCSNSGDEDSSSSSSIPVSSEQSESSSSTAESSEEPEPASVPTGSSSSTAASSEVKKQAVRVTIPEGYALSQIGDKLEAAGVCKKSELLSVSNSYDFSYYPLVAAIPANENRCYKLEGYLFPNTYDFYQNMKPQDALGIMLRGAGNKIGSNYSYPGMTTDDIVIFASVLEKECARKSEMGRVSSVLHNRLKAGMKLQMDATIYYVERHLKPNLTGDINRYNAYYNTYKCAALPAGPICNPSTNALKATVNPEDNNYLFFAVDKNGTYLYADTYEKHKENLKNTGLLESSEP